MIRWAWSVWWHLFYLALACVVGTLALLVMLLLWLASKVRRTRWTT